jgi:hypothetical protein
MTPPIFGSCASARPALQVNTRPNTIFFSMTYLLMARSANSARQALLKHENAGFREIEKSLSRGGSHGANPGRKMKLSTNGD